MAKFVDISKVKGVQFVAVKFHETAERKESTALELRFLDCNGVSCGSASMPLLPKKVIVEAGTEAAIVTSGTTRVPFKGTWDLKGLQVMEGDRNASQWRVYGDFEVVGPSAVKRLEYKDVVEGFNPFNV